jgi:choline dehydrogenase
VDQALQEHASRFERCLRRRLDQGLVESALVGSGDSDLGEHRKVDSVSGSAELASPYFKAQETNDTFGDAYHGTAGPLQVSHLGFYCGASRAYVKALGNPFNPNFNGASQCGVGFMQHTIDRRRYRRCSAIDAFIRPLGKDLRLTIVTSATVTRLLFEGARVVGAEYVTDGRTETAHPDCEVLMAAGPTRPRRS